MIAIDTNILLHAHREDSPWHEVAFARLAELAEGHTPWGIPWPCIHEFLSIATHPRIYAPPSPLATALDQVDAWLEAPSLVLLAESGRYWRYLRTAAEQGRISGPRIHDARIAALRHYHGVRQLWTADRDFGRFPDLAIRNPLIA